MSRSEPRSPLTIIAIFAGIIEASALASLPFLGEDSQGIYTWFLVGFPFFLTVLFFLTLNFNYKSLCSPDLLETATSTPPLAAPEDPSAFKSQPVKKNTDIVENPAKHAPEPAERNEIPATTVTISLKGAGAQQRLDAFVAQALREPGGPCDTWIICNLEAGTQITLVSQVISQ
ncbi:hypothetical protein [Pseudomonas sp. JUb96]|uniref:hypothetical protein n=1 Tax=Pseudomonas sp. JUb96 TaxID=2940539 RepID=UPI00222620F5|nr:hypothetical protein [Pseudomonas sp. JUb96]MCW2270080.1 hypothetical protein [Pseudomonas sp. JUb96]